MRKALVVASIWPFFNFEKKDIILLQNLGYEVHCATNFEIGIDHEVKIDNIKRHQIDFSRSPFSIKTIKAFMQLNQLLRENDFSIVHCHTPVAGILTRIAAKKFRKKGMRVLYTSHGFHFYKGAPIKNWIMYYPIEKICSRYTDAIITINQEDYELVCSRFKAQENIRIPGVGIDLNQFFQEHSANDTMRSELGIAKGNKIILSVGEQNDNKNHRLIISSLAKLGDTNIHYVMAGSGEAEERNRMLAKKLGIINQVHFLGYRTDIPRLDNVADIFAFPSIREGLGLAAIEALACGTPVIGMNTRGINEYVKDDITGYLFCNDVDSCCEAIVKCLKLKDDTMLPVRCIEAAKKYDAQHTQLIMKSLYEKYSYTE